MIAATRFSVRFTAHATVNCTKNGWMPRSLFPEEYVLAMVGGESSGWRDRKVPLYVRPGEPGHGGFILWLPLEDGGRKRVGTDDWARRWLESMAPGRLPARLVTAEGERHGSMRELIGPFVASLSALSDERPLGEPAATLVLEWSNLVIEIEEGPDCDVLVVHIRAATVDGGTDG